MLKKAGAFSFGEELHFHLVGSVAVTKLQLSNVLRVYLLSFLLLVEEDEE